MASASRSSLSHPRPSKSGRSWSTPCPPVAELMPIRGNDRTWTYTGNGMRMGKQEHMASVAEELMAKPALGVTDVRKESTLLVDDDPRNIKKCLKDGTRAVWFNPRDPYRLLDDLILLN